MLLLPINRFFGRSKSNEKATARFVNGPIAIRSISCKWISAVWQPNLSLLKRLIQFLFVHWKFWPKLSVQFLLEKYNFWTLEHLQIHLCHEMFHLEFELAQEESFLFDLKFEFHGPRIRDCYCQNTTVPIYTGILRLFASSSRVALIAPCLGLQFPRTLNSHT